MGDNVAILAGYTEELTCTCGVTDLYLLIKPDTDTDGRFKAWCMDDQEFIWVNGWLCVFDYEDA